ncbi:hypothetical protein BV22DRAFT_917271 [Leucogyrophana mollusca]|uniref:Uncharacterized protein n=1 Tax=Leucogyrophana mollusca TaxID=85980 RepID=A0ACB8AX78_9AGAM|nr:hypothetical protein BV22DRAFT_917271 [Leucogyrophana mollusca]
MTPCLLSCIHSNIVRLYGDAESRTRTVENKRSVRWLTEARVLARLSDLAFRPPRRQRGSSSSGYQMEY